MKFLTEAVLEHTAVKAGLFGPGGAGKSVTATLIALALSKTYHNGAPVALMDTEGRASDWLIELYAIEKVKLLRIKSRAFDDMRGSLREAEQSGCCAFICDSYSHPWAELQETLKKKLRVQKLEFHHMQQLQEMWGAWVREFLDSPLHCLFAGRLAYEWENEVDVETGKMGFHKAGTKMRSEKDAGYEPHLLIEMEAERVMDEIREQKIKVGAGDQRTTKIKKTRVEKKAGGHFVHRMHVLKDRGMALNAGVFEFRDINAYKAGDWKLVYKALKPHFDKIRIGASTIGRAIEERTSEVAGAGDGSYQLRVKQVGIALEEIDGTLRKLWPSDSAKEKALRNLAVEVLFDTRSWKAVESKSLESLKAGHAALRTFEERTLNGDAKDALTDPVAAAALLQIVKAGAEQGVEDMVL